MIHLRKMGIFEILKTKSTENYDQLALEAILGMIACIDLNFQFDIFRLAINSFKPFQKFWK